MRWNADTFPGPLALASQSPRRRLLLEQAGVPHEPIATGVDDGTLAYSGTSPVEWVASLAYLKAAAGVQRLRERGTGPRLVLGADTVCVVDSEVMSHPRDADDARRMIKLMEGRTHEVLTGVALIDASTGERDLFVDRATVHVGAIGDAAIDAYIASDQWQGKAGAYNLNERIDAGWPIRYDGDPTTIMGLPMKKLLRRLERVGGSPPCSHT